MSIRDLQLAAREHLMQGMQMQLSIMSEKVSNNGKSPLEPGWRDRIDPVVYDRALYEFRRVEKFLGFEPGSWRAGV